MKKYLTLLLAAAREQISHLKTLSARVLLMLIMLTIFRQFWMVVKAETLDSQTIQPTDLIWYLLLGCLLQYGRPEGLHHRIEEDVRTGDIAYCLLRPVSYIGAKLCESLGTFLVRLPILLFFGGVWAIYLSGGELPHDFQALPVILILLTLSMIVLSLGTIFVGLSALFLQDSLPLFWMIQKAEYILGGLFFPLTLYPQWLQTLAMSTPFGYAGYGVSHLIYEFSWISAVQTGGMLLLWIIGISGILKLMYVLLMRKVAINGG